MAKRFTKSTVKWSELMKLVPPEEKDKYLAFKGKAEAYLQRVNSNPDTPPKIDWEAYQKSVPVKGLVEKLKSEYECFKVPFPADTMTVKVDEQWKDLEVQIKAYCEKQQKIADQASKQLEKLNALPAFENITMEMFYDLYPEHALDSVNKPTFWPHDEEEQLGYKNPEQIGH